MNWVTRVLVSQLVVMLDWVAATADSMDAAQCLERGFNSAKLLCSSCEDLKQFDLGKVASDCSACCVSDGGSAALENTKYERAILEVRNIFNCNYLLLAVLIIFCPRCVDDVWGRTRRSRRSSRASDPAGIPASPSSMSVGRTLSSR